MVGVPKVFERASRFIANRDFRTDAGRKQLLKDATLPTAALIIGSPLSSAVAAESSRVSPEALTRGIQLVPTEVRTAPEVREPQQLAQSIQLGAGATFPVGRNGRITIGGVVQFGNTNFYTINEHPGYFYQYSGNSFIPYQQISHPGGGYSLQRVTNVNVIVIQQNNVHPQTTAPQQTSSCFPIRFYQTNVDAHGQTVGHNQWQNNGCDFSQWNDPYVRTWLHRNGYSHCQSATVRMTWRHGIQNPTGLTVNSAQCGIH